MLVLLSLLSQMNDWTVALSDGPAPLKPGSYDTSVLLNRGVSSHLAPKGASRGTR